MKKTITFSKAGTSYITKKVRETVSAPLKMLFTAAGAADNKGCYSLNGIEDISEEEMLAIYTHKEAIDNLDLPQAMQGCKVRTIIPCRQDLRERLKSRPLNGERSFADSSIEVLKFGNRQEIDCCDEANAMPTTQLAGTFKGCAALHTLYPMNLKSVSHIGSDTFEGCCALQEVRFYGLGTAVRLTDSPLISYRSLHYAVMNSNNGDFEITIHPMTYKYMMAMEQAPAIVGGTHNEWAKLQADGENKNIIFNTTQFFISIDENVLCIGGIDIREQTLILDNEIAATSSNILFFV